MVRRGATFGLPPDEQQDDHNVLADPLGDLLLSVAAIFVLAIMLMLPLGSQLSKRTREPEQNVELSHESLEDLLRIHEPMRLLATRQGLRFGKKPPDYISVGRILDDERLAKWFENSSTDNHATILFIEPGGLESAFAFEVAVRHLIRDKMIQVRLLRRCEDLRSLSLHRLCSFEGGNVLQ